MKVRADVSLCRNFKYFVISACIPTHGHAWTQIGQGKNTISLGLDVWQCRHKICASVSVAWEYMVLCFWKCIWVRDVTILIPYRQYTHSKRKNVGIGITNTNNTRCMNERFLFIALVKYAGCNFVINKTFTNSKVL